MINKHISKFGCPPFLAWQYHISINLMLELTLGYVLGHYLDQNLTHTTCGKADLNSKLTFVSAYGKNATEL
jgi:hypothetical protein